MNLYFDTLGRGDDVVWLHGWAMNGAVWRDSVSGLVDEACHHLVDLPGHGRSGTDEALSLAMMVDALDAAFPYPVHVVGWSLGGAVAAAWAARSPDKLRSLTLVASSPCFMQRPDWRSAMPEKTLAQFAASLQDDWRGTLKRFISLQAMGDDAARAVARRLGDELFEHGEPGLAALSEGLAILRDTDLRADIGRLTLPVLLQFGDRDTLTPLPAGAWLAQALPQAELIVHRSAAHVPFISHRDAFVSAQRRFLASI
ncbi:pimeloyl-[acyl-carrier protein] methyl ester esterase [Jeongeupia sp. HS-3]|uniref:pimeloyl-ACP methyl ester esterase BioH n=1 Tax=Jeongeupia sp. HS-3 TaxID=1009682 RepID=UPI0018A5384B|nr:pimeloyl-ACP methyl ester esterase BioH [Jeongeupia sp. HS-3]BCL76277.1 pimeloyl-[acyl-carrier protein] methyl ester esterase [Jeongeupia sp. HS-3]